TFPELVLGIHTLQPDLPSQRRTLISDPCNPAQCLAAAAFNRDNLPGFLDALQSGYPRSMRRHVVGARHLDPRLHVLVQVEDPDRQGDMDSFIAPFAFWSVTRVSHGNTKVQCPKDRSNLRR